MSIVTLPAAPVFVQFSDRPSLDPCAWLRLEAFATHTRLFQTAMYFARGGLPPSAAAVLVLSTFTGLVPDVAPFTPIAKPPNVTHCQKTLLGRVSAPDRVVSPVPLVSMMRRVVPSVSRIPISPVSMVK